MLSGFPFSQSVVDILSTGEFTIMYAAELDFKDGMVRVHTGTGSLVINGETYEGVGTLGSVSAARETNDASGPLKINLTLSGLDSDIVKESLQDRCRGRQGRVYFVAIDRDGNQAADILFSGRMDAAKFTFDQSDSSIVVPLVDRMAEWDRRNVKRWTDENHQLRHPGDRFFKAVSQVSEWPIRWGSAVGLPSTGGGDSADPRPPEMQR